MAKITQLLIVLLGLLMQFDVKSQKKDYIGWYEIGVDKNISKKINLQIGAQTRFEHNSSSLESWLYTAEVKYKFNKKWKAILQSRYRTSDEKDVFRIGGGINYDFKIKNIKLDIRQLYQLDVPVYNITLDDNNAKRHQLRSRLKAGYDIGKKVSTSFATEAYFRFNEGEIYTARLRYALGLEYEVIKNTSIEIQYLYQPNYHPTGYLRRIDYIGSISIQHKL